MMTAQERQDFAPIKKVFPDASFEDGEPCIRMTIDDAEADPVRVSIDGEGVISFDTDGYSYLMMTPDDLTVLARLGQKAREIFDDWTETPSGKAWAKSNGL